jgi:RimJ/RimL family protein N-acetyltransferase
LPDRSWKPASVPSSHPKPEPQPPGLVGRSTRLRPITPNDYEALYALAISDQVNYRWRFRGGIPNFEVFVQTLHADVLAQFVITRLTDPSPLGLTVTYTADMHNGTTFMAAVTDPALHRTGMGIEAMALFVRYILTTWNFRKIYLEVIEYNLPQFASVLERGATVEGTLKAHAYYDGGFWDQWILALYREPGLALAERILRQPGDLR